MTTFRLLPDGTRRRLPNGGVRALGADGPRYADVQGHAGFRSSSSARATLALLAVGETRLAFSLSGTLSRAGFIGHATLRFGLSGHLSRAVSIAGHVLLGPHVSGRTTARVATTGMTGLGLALDGRAVASRAIGGSTSLSATAIGDLTVAPWVNIRGATTLRLGLAGTLTANQAGKFRDLWLDVYDKRQKVLNAIDANNRYLAKSAGDAADAAANAVVQTVTRVDEIEDGLEAEALRVTALETSMGSVQSQQATHGTAISALQTWSSNAAGTLTSHSNQLTSVSASITSLDGQVVSIANATSLLSAEVTSLGAVKALYGLYLDVNGYIAGFESINDGVTAQFNILADVLRIISPSAANGFEYQDGYIRVFSTVGSIAYMLVIGSRFGANNDLMMWYGTLRAVDTCTQANCVECKTYDGKTIRRASQGGAERLDTALLTEIKVSGVTRVRMGVWD